MAMKTTGVTQMQAIVAQHARNLPKRAAAALYQEAEAIMSTSKPLAPIDTGAMRSSGYVAPPSTDGNRISVEFGYGGAAADYVIYVHEDLTKRHAAPTQAKFLEQPLREAAPGLPQRLATRINFDRS